MNNQDYDIDEDIKTLLHGFCMCGCGTIIPFRDHKNRPIRYVCGHNRRKVKEPILVEILKITDLETAKHIIMTQAKIIHELQQQSSTRYKDSLTGQ
jgi:hypothetical protein